MPAHREKETGIKQEDVPESPGDFSHALAPLTIQVNDSPQEIKQEGASSDVQSQHEQEIWDDGYEPYGLYCSEEESDRIETWLSNIPRHAELEDADKAASETHGQYLDLLHWSRDAALDWLRKLDKYERRFRAASLKYHRIPHHIRHSSKVLFKSIFEQAALDRVASILETDRARDQQPFFIPWLEVKDTVLGIMSDLELHQPLPDDTEFLRTIYKKIELLLETVPRACYTLLDGLEWLEDAVAGIVARSELDGSGLLLSRFTREGGLIRRWILTLPELHYDDSNKARFIEWYVDRLLDIGIEKDAYWSGLMIGGGVEGEAAKS